MADTKDRTKQKACLERYRRACIEILGVLNKAAPQVWRPSLSFKCAMKMSVYLLQTLLAGPGRLGLGGLSPLSRAPHQTTAESRC